MNPVIHLLEATVAGLEQRLERDEREHAAIEKRIPEIKEMITYAQAQLEKVQDIVAAEDTPEWWLEQLLATAEIDRRRPQPYAYWVDERTSPSDRDHHKYVDRGLGPDVSSVGADGPIELVQ